jgi:uncharacterized protein with FMN-binding domain
MRRITLWLVSTVAALVLLFSYRTSLSGPAASPGGNPGTDANPPGIVSGPDTPSGGSGSSGAGMAPSTVDGQGATVVNGSVARTRWGPVQVQVRISGGRIVDVTTLQVPAGNDRDVEINQYAVPQLRQQVLAAQSANIDGVSGATVTSDGYRQSLQSALDAAHFGG